jgi:hypothetical protein
MLLKNISTGLRGIAIQGSIVFADVGEVIGVEGASDADILDAIDAGYFEEVKSEAKPKGRVKAQSEAAE